MFNGHFQLSDIEQIAKEANVISNAHKDGEVYSYWVKQNPKYDFKTNVWIGEVATKKKYQGIAMANTDYMVFW